MRDLALCRLVCICMYVYACSVYLSMNEIFLLCATICCGSYDRGCPQLGRRDHRRSHRQDHHRVLT